MPVRACAPPSLLSFRLLNDYRVSESQHINGYGKNITTNALGKV